MNELKYFLYEKDELALTQIHKIQFDFVGLLPLKYLFQWLLTKPVYFNSSPYWWINLSKNASIKLHWVTAISLLLAKPSRSGENDGTGRSIILGSFI